MAFAYDSSNSRIFAHGTIGDAHVAAHAALDTGDLAMGRRLLGEFLENKQAKGSQAKGSQAKGSQAKGSQAKGSQWVHLQWHMLVFDLAFDHWDAAFDRYLDFIHPSTTSQDDALCDAPSALWRLALAKPDATLPWSAVCAVANRQLHRSLNPFDELHCLLALAGAGDVAALDNWLLVRVPSSDEDRVLQTFAAALRSYCTQALERSRTSFRQALSGLPLLGGSRAQNELPWSIYEHLFERPHAPLLSLPLQGAAA